MFIHSLQQWKSKTIWSCNKLSNYVMLRAINRDFISKIFIYMYQASFMSEFFFLIKTNDKFSKEYRKKPRTGEKPRICPSEKGNLKWLETWHPWALSCTCRQLFELYKQNRQTKMMDRDCPLISLSAGKFQSESQANKLV